MKKSKLSKKVTPENCAERRYVSLTTALAVSSKASKATTIDTGNMISSSGREALRARGRDSSFEERLRGECTSEECVNKS